MLYLLIMFIANLIQIFFYLLNSDDKDALHITLPKIKEKNNIIQWELKLIWLSKIKIHFFNTEK